MCTAWESNMTSETSSLTVSLAGSLEVNPEVTCTPRLHGLYFIDMGVCKNSGAPVETQTSRALITTTPIKRDPKLVKTAIRLQGRARCRAAAVQEAFRSACRCAGSYRGAEHHFAVHLKLWLCQVGPQTTT